MPGYLENYRTGEERREKIIWRTVWTTLAVLILAVILYFTFRTYREDTRIKAFLGKLRDKDYQTAYTFWGCDPQSPCKDYNFQRFLEDWGPQGQHPDVSAAKIAKTKACDTGVIEILNFQGGQVVNLWVDKKSQVIGFAPWPVCNPRLPR